MAPAVLDRPRDPVLADSEERLERYLQRRSLSGLVVREPVIPAEELPRVLRELEHGVIKDMGLGDRALEAVKRGEATIVMHPETGERRLVPVAKGGALGQGAVYQRNLPMPGTYDINPTLFAAKTARNQKTYAQIAHPGFGASFNQRVDAVGVVSRLLLIFEGTVTSTATPATVVPGAYPWNFAKSIVVSANGLNQLFACEGLDLRALMRVRNAKHFFDRESSFAIPGASSAGTLRLIWEIPLAYDDSLIGAVFAQTEETSLSITVTTPTSAEMFSANPPASFTNSNWRVVAEFYSIPTADSQAGRVIVIPDLTQLHGVVARDDGNVAAGSDHIAPLTRTGGILLRTLQRFDDPNPGDIDPGGSTLGGNITSHRFRYGGNVVPVDIPGFTKRLINEMDYGDAVLPSIDTVAAGTAASYIVDDYVIDSPLRDVIHLTGITEAQMINAVRAGLTINAGAKFHTVQEAMTAG